MQATHELTLSLVGLTSIGSVSHDFHCASFVGGLPLFYTAFLFAPCMLGPVLEGRDGIYLTRQLRHIRES